jgi:putative ABC transport system permease protein
MRPKNPKSGKKIFIEKINFIWKKIKFSEKITIRNIFRYKARVFTTIFGIAGCTALILAGFGLKDSIKEVTREIINEFVKKIIVVKYDSETNSRDIKIEWRYQFYFC